MDASSNPSHIDAGLGGGDAQVIASRAMVAQDAKWLSNALISARGEDGVWSIALFGHATRVVFEGSKIARDERLGVPALAELLTTQHAAEIERSRQASKLLDDKLISLAELRAEMASTYAAHHARFTGNAVWFARGLETDLALATLNDRVIAASIPLDRRFGLEALDESSVMPLAETLGSALTVLAAMTGETSIQVTPVDYQRIGRVTWRDRLAGRELKRSYESNMAIETKFILLLVESEVATSAEVLPHTAGGIQLSVFRSQTVVLFHALSTIRAVLDAEPGLSARSNPMLQFLQSEEAAYFLKDPAFRMVRNYAMHYGIRDPAFVLDLQAPMFGLVESLTGERIQELADQVAGSTIALADLLRDWRVQ
ncbi:hypothetical protein D9V28_06295 [Mycetocola zhadangensis]|uniref:Uncharacterized protein n=2 Tax=Mycetocola zhadangensis TaxID=1164595 RepID=A0A3L7JAB8_9MICO|nr:hypothetical protein D9V28_06295 [Mycetocola zhadangensis]